jgi:hypothetical protein
MKSRNGNLENRMSNKKYWIGFWAIVAGGLILRLMSLCPFGFFGDVPLQLTAIQTNTVKLNFPGYMPIQLLFSGMSRLGLTPFDAMWLVTLACGMGSIIYVALAGRKAAGEEFSLLAATVMAFGILPVYFSVVGATYATDMLSVSGLLFHGWEFIQRRKAGSYYFALGWVCFGIMARPLSAGFCCAGLAVLLWHGRDWRAWLVTAVALALTLAAYAAISLPYYGSWAAMMESRASAMRELEGQNLKSVLTNLTRAGVYPIYGFQVWLVFMAWLALKNWQFQKRRPLLFLAAFAGPYFLFLLRYIPQAGYYGLLIPVLVLLPACFLPPVPPDGVRLFAGVAAAFVAVAACQWLLVRPVPTTSLSAGAANAYVLQYSRSGIKQGMFETLSSIMYKHNLDTNLIQPKRMQQVMKGGQ